MFKKTEERKSKKDKAFSWSRVCITHATSSAQSEWRKIRMRRRWKRKGRQRGTQSTTTETIRGAGWQQQMLRCRQDGELAPGTPVAGPAWDITRQMRSRADQRNAPHWERLNGCWCAPATTALWLQIISRRRRRRRRLRTARARGSAWSGPNSDLMHSHLVERCSCCRFR